MQTLRKIDIAEIVEEIKLICILESINNCPIYNQPEFGHHEASSLATISVFPLGVRNMGAFPYGIRSHSRLSLSVLLEQSDHLMSVSRLNAT